MKVCIVFIHFEERSPRGSQIYDFLFENLAIFGNTSALSVLITEIYAQQIPKDKWIFEK